MGLVLAHESPQGQVWCGDSTAQALPVVDCLISDPPYSERTVSGHNAVAGKHSSGDEYARAKIEYGPWSALDALRAVEQWHAACRGWIVVINDHILIRVFEQALEDTGRLVAAPVPIITPGGRFRMHGDAPPSCTDWMIVARPREKRFIGWGNLPPYYIATKEFRKCIRGGKPLGLMRSLVSDYSRPGDIVADPCMGAGTTLLAAEDLGRRYWGCDLSQEHVDMTIGRLGGSVQYGPLFGDAR